MKRLLMLLALLPWMPAAALDLVFVGDVMLADGPGKTIAAGGDPLAEFDAELRGADFSIANLECPVARSGKALENKIWTFRADPAALSVLKGRFNAVSLANNHSGDYGPEAFVETLDQLAAAHLPFFGGGRNLAQAHAPLWVEKKGIRIAVLAYDEFKPRSFEAGAKWPGVAWSEDSQVVADIRAARATGADLVIPFMHWGWEHESRPSARQWQLAKRMIEAGADAVVGSHPHVTQGADVYRGRPIVWSLGNFVFDGFSSPETTHGWLLKMRLDKKGVVAFETREAAIDEAGTPHPSNGASPCWRRGQAKAVSCRAAGKRGL